MRALRGNSLGLSEIVGTLMLVLIVVSAATAFSLFVAGYQKQLQQKQAIAQDKSLESVEVLRVTPALNAVPNYVSLNFTVASLYINPVTVTEVSLNNNPLAQYNASRLNLSSGAFTWVTIGAGGQLALGPREQINIVVSLLRGNPFFSPYNSSFVLHGTDFIKLELITTLENDFSRLFIPPTAIGVVSTTQTLSGGVFQTVTILDGTHSFQPGNATLVSWHWAVAPDALNVTGEEAVVNFNSTFSSHTITLTVTNSDGLEGVETFAFA